MEWLLYVGGAIFGVLLLLTVAQIIRNLRSPVEAFPAQVVAKRTGVRGGGNTPAHTTYYVTFENKGGARLEMPVSGRQYGMLAEGDAGMLKLQGTWFKGFHRHVR